jgi:putative MATE family efflux protein
MRDFTEGNIYKQVIAFSLPLLAGNFLQFFYSIIDSIIVGRFLGTQSFAAISCTMPILFFLTAFLIGMGVATNVLVAQSYGAKNMDFMKKVLANSLMVSVLIAVVISAVSITFHSWILDWVNTPAEIKPQASIFFVIVCCGLVFQFTYNWFSGILRGLGDAHTPLYILIGSTILNIILVPLFIMVFKMGVAGAAVGTVLANFISLIWGYFYTIKKYEIFHVGYWDFTVDWAIIKKILIIGLPSSFQMMVTSFSGTMIMSLVNTFGTNVTAAYGIGMQADGIAFVPAMTISIAISTMVGQNLGVEKYHRVKEIFAVASKLAVGIGCALCAFAFFFPHAIASLFTTNQDVLVYVTPYFRIVSFSYITFAIMFSLQGVVRGAGDTMVMLIFSLIALIIIRVPLAYYLAHHTLLAERGIWTSILASTFVGIILSYGYYRSGRWMRVKILPGHKSPAQNNNSLSANDEVRSSS